MDLRTAEENHEMEKVSMIKEREARGYKIQKGRQENTKR